MADPTDNPSEPKNRTVIEHVHALDKTTKVMLGRWAQSLSAY